MASEMTAALRDASQACQEMEVDYPEAPALGEYIDVDRRRRSTADSGCFSGSFSGSFSLSSLTFKEDTARLAESMMASGVTTELCEAGRAGNEYIAVETSIQEAGIDLDGDDEGVINASGRAAQTRRGGGLRTRLSASDLGVIDQDAAEVEPLYDSLSFPMGPPLTAVAHSHIATKGTEPFYLAPIVRRRLGSKASGGNDADRQVLGHAYEDLRGALTSPPSVPPPETSSCASEQTYEYENRLSLDMPLRHPYSPAPPSNKKGHVKLANCSAVRRSLPAADDENAYDDIQNDGLGPDRDPVPKPESPYSKIRSWQNSDSGIYEHVCTVTHH